MLLGAGSEVDAVTTSGSTALHSAASNGHADVVQRLIAAGADVDVQVPCFTLGAAACRITIYAAYLSMLESTVDGLRFS